MEAASVERLQCYVLFHRILGQQDSTSGGVRGEIGVRGKVVGGCERVTGGNTVG
jgi:hypothetical protein